MNDLLQITHRSVPAIRYVIPGLLGWVGLSVIVITLIVWLAHGVAKRRPPLSRLTEVLLRRSYARGEIDEKTYEQELRRRRQEH